MHVHVGVYACLCVCMHICFLMCVAARGQLQKPSLAHCQLLETGSLRPRAHGVCKAGCLASKCPSIPASAALWYESTYHTQLFHVASGVQPQVLILTSQTLADRAITPACHSLLYISISIQPHSEGQKAGISISNLGKGMLLPITHSF